MNIGKFQIIDRIGGGNFGQVYKVNDTLLNVVRAIKIINVQCPEEFADAIREAQIQEKCRHKNIVDLKEIEIFQYNNALLPCIAMEYLPKGSVQDYLEKNFVTVKKTIKIITDVLFGLEHAHNQGIFHRDIKPGNIMFSNSSNAKLSDFGISYGLANQPFHFNGYKPHLPPEVISNSVQDELSDIYSLGITFYRLLNNIHILNLPHNSDAKNLADINKKKFPRREFSPHLPPPIIRVLKKSMEPDRSKRFQSCLQFRQALEKISLAINWSRNSDNYWKGKYQGDNYSIALFQNKRGQYFIDFKKNNRRMIKYCCEKIEDQKLAYKEFYGTIRETTLKVDSK